MHDPLIGGLVGDGARLHDWQAIHVGAQGDAGAGGATPDDRHHARAAHALPQLSDAVAARVRAIAVGAAVTDKDGRTL